MTRTEHGSVDKSRLSQYAIDDLEASGLKPRDVAARPLGPSELAATGITSSNRIPDGYVIPYFDPNGDSIAYYRVKILDTHAGPKYRAPKGLPNHVYFPPGLQRLLRGGEERPNYIIITEGEKKAACMVARGFPTVALSGVDNWRNRHITFPEDTELKAYKSRGVIQAKIPPGDSNAMVLEDSGVVAVGFHELTTMLVQQQMEAIIVFDSDQGGVGVQVQRAAAQLGYELRYRGMPIVSIRQLILPSSKRGDKVGLDDYIMARGVASFAKILRVCRRRRIAFPRHPNPKVFVASRLQKSRLSRKETQDVALSILMELETRGRRLRNRASQEVYFFDEKTHTLMLVALGNPRIQLHDTSFGAYLYQEFNLAAVDQRIVGWLAAQFHGEPGIEETTTHKVFARPKEMPNCIAYQLSDSHFIIITPNPEKPYIICENGTHGVLFEQNQVVPISHRAIEGEIEEHIERFQEQRERGGAALWREAIEGFNFNPLTTPIEGGTEPPTAEESQRLATLLFYLSPWFLRWRGMQLPVELVIGEPGSGKSSLYEFRQTIITGRSRLANMTSDIRDWYAGITAHGGMHVMDNVHFTGATKDYNQRLSDEICRLVTDPEPHIELRKLYTTSDIVYLPVNTTFVLTAVEQPFFRTDLIQRSAIFELQAIQDGHDANWVDHQFERGGGRLGWVAHHIAVIHRFLKIAIHDGRWDPNYRAGHRLAHYEQGLMIMSRALGIPEDWVPAVLGRQVAVKESEADWTLTGLEVFIQEWREEHGQEKFAAADIVLWAETHEDYCKNPQLNNPWKLGKYLRQHKGGIQRRLGMYEEGSRANKRLYTIKATK